MGSSILIGSGVVSISEELREIHPIFFERDAEVFLDDNDDAHTNRILRLIDHMFTHSVIYEKRIFTGPSNHLDIQEDPVIAYVIQRCPMIISLAEYEFIYTNSGTNHSDGNIQERSHSVRHRHEKKKSSSERLHKIQSHISDCQHQQFSLDKYVHYNETSSPHQRFSLDKYMHHSETSSPHHSIIRFSMTSNHHPNSQVHFEHRRPTKTLEEDEDPDKDGCPPSPPSSSKCNLLCCFRADNK
jgi:hypothetical protein